MGRFESRLKALENQLKPGVCRCLLEPCVVMMLRDVEAVELPFDDPDLRPVDGPCPNCGRSGAVLYCFDPWDIALSVKQGRIPYDERGRIVRPASKSGRYRSVTFESWQESCGTPVAVSANGRNRS